MKNIHLIPTDKPSKIGLHFDIIKTGRLDYAPNFGFNEFNKENNYKHNPQNIYITSDSDIKEGDLILPPSNIPVRYDGQKYKGDELLKCWKKIIMTTNQDLIKDGVQAIDDEFLEWFVKNPSCEEVKWNSYPIDPNGNVIGTNFPYPFDGLISSFKIDYKIIIPKEEPKQVWEQIIETCGGKEEFMKSAGLLNKYESLEEAAEKYSDKTEKYVLKCRISKESISHLGLYLGFIEGAKWQQERMYSEEEVYKIILNYQSDHPYANNEIGLKKWFEKFKKK
jgi:hypothetical protein